MFPYLLVSFKPPSALSAKRGAPNAMTASGVRDQPSASARVAARMAKAAPKLWPVKTSFQ